MTGQTRLNRRAWSVLAVAGWAGAVVLPVSAQIAANNGGGRALDANPQVGSNGGNRIENQVDYSARNDLITGNVAGGFGFQDSVGYSAPGAFQDSLGSDTLFSYRAASLGSDPRVANIQGAGTIRGGNVVVYQEFTSVPSSRQINTPTVFAPTGGVFRVNRDVTDNAATQFTLNRSASTPYDAQYNATPGLPGNASANTLGILRIEDGSALAVTADPLTGVRRRAIPQVQQPATGLPGNLGGVQDSTLKGFDASPQNNLIPAAPLDSNQLLTQGAGDPAKLDAANPRYAFTDSTGLVKPSLQLGQIATNSANASAATLEQRVKELQDSIFGPTANGGTNRPGTPGSDEGDAANSYNQLLEQIREQAQQSAAERAAALERDGFDARPEWMRAMDEPSEDEVQAAEGTLEATMQRIRERSGTADNDGASANAAGTGDDNAAAAEALNELMSDLSYNVRLETLVAAREGRVNKLFAEAETQMAAGQFLNAERTYRQVRIEAANNPLGLAGLIHAQLGAGMVRSAAFNLRSLFEDHPELIATRYGQNLLPPQDRLEWLQKELQRMIDTQSGAIDPGLMMAYLGYQIESRPLVRQGLAIAQNASPIDPLLPVLRSIWLDQKPVADESSK